MSSAKLQGNINGTGTITIQTPNTNSNRAQNLPDVDGTFVLGVSAVSATGQIPFSTDGATYTPTAKIVSATAVASTSGTSIDFTGIPSWVKRITVMFSGVSLSGSSNYLVQVGAGSVVTTGYVSAGAAIPSGSTAVILTSTSGFLIRNAQAATAVVYGQMVLTVVSGNTWVSSHSYGDSVSSVTGNGGGNVTLSGTLDRVRITTVNGTDTFDAGSINILYE